MAATPASSSRRAVSRLRESGDAEATSGFFRARPRYVVVKSGIVVLLCAYALMSRSSSRYSPLLLLPPTRWPCRDSAATAPERPPAPHASTPQPALDRF